MSCLDLGMNLHICLLFLLLISTFHANATTGSLAEPLLDGQLVRISVKATPDNRQAIPGGTIGKVKNEGEKRLEQAGVFSDEGDNKYILSIVAQSQQWDCSGVGELGGYQNKLQHRLGQLSDHFEYSLKQIRPEKRTVFESTIQVVDRQQYGMEPFCLKGWREAQSERAALMSLEMFELQLKQFAGQDVRVEIESASQNMLKIKQMDGAEGIVTAMIRSVDGIVDLVSSTASLAGDIGAAFASSQAFSESHMNALRYADSDKNQLLVNPYYLEAQKQRLKAANKTVSSGAGQKEIPEGLTLTQSKKQKRSEPLSCDDRIRSISGTMRWNGHSCRVGDIAAFSEVRFESLYKCDSNSDNLLFRDMDKQRRDNCEGDVELIYHTRNEAGIHKPSGLTKYLYKRKYKCSCKPIQIKVQDGNSITR